MANIVGGYFTSHVPAIGGALVKGLQQDAYWKPFFDAYPPVKAWTKQQRPDVVVVFYNDHGLNFFLDKMPTFAVGAAKCYANADEGWGLPLYKPFNGHPALSWHIIEHLIDQEFDIVTCQQMVIDHGLSIPFELGWDEADSRSFRLVPININTVQHPLPSPKRCLALGRAVADAIASWDSNERVVIVGTGGLSHQLDGERAGHINKDYDTFCLDNMGPDPDALTDKSSLDIVELAGSQGVEVLNWLAARGAIGGDVSEITRSYHIPISNTAASTLVLERVESLPAQ